jgi:predicted dehydrogenase
MKKLKIGIIGTGSFARKAHYTSLAKINSAELVAICENKYVDRMQKLAENYDIPEKYTDYTQMLLNADKLCRLKICG